LLGSVAVTSLIVHFAVLSHVSWMGNYWQGGSKKVALNESTAPVNTASATPGFSVSVTPVAAADGKGGTSFVVTVAPGVGAPTTVAAVQADPVSRPPDRLALAKPE